MDYLWGGWLFIWETFSDLFIKSHKLMEDRRIVQRFKRAEIQFVQRVLIYSMI